MNPMDIIAGTALVIGSALIALGAFGLLRFPDVFTRMHAATKAASVGVICTTLAATFEVGSLSGVLILLIVIALLFLSGPLGMSLLARAAYHDPQTPRSPNTQDLDVELPIPESTTTTHKGGTNWWLALWLFIVWIAAFGTLTPGVIAGGLAVSGLVAWTFRGLAPRWPSAFLHPIAAWQFAWFFLGQLVMSTWDVIWSLRLPPEDIHPAILEVPLRVRTRNEVTVLMNSISFTPGTVALELHDSNLYVHVLTTRDPDRDLEAIAAMESHVMAVFRSPVRG